MVLVRLDNFIFCFQLLMATLFTCHAMAGGRKDCGISNGPPKKIVNGKVTGVNEYPWQVALVKRNRNNVNCGGSLISKKWVMTAAHCKVSASEDQVILGNHRQYTVDPNEIRVNIKKVANHPGYYNHFIYGYPLNDLSLLELAHQVDIMPICLPMNKISNQFDNVIATVTGWGAIYSKGPTSTVLLEASVNTMENSKCKAAYADTKYQEIPPSMICAANNGADTCQGDSGGPLMTEVLGKYVLIGVTSWGEGCGTYPGVYARITNHVLTWIRKTMSSNTNIDPPTSVCPTPWITIDGQCFLVPRSDNFVTWEQARSHCQNAAPGADLAQPRNIKAFAQYLRNHGFGVTHYWIGGTDADHEGDWRWVNGDRIPENNWYNGEPDDADSIYGGNGADCLRVQPGTPSNSLLDTPCGDNWKYICQRP